MRLTKSQRAALREKFAGRCAYCGDPLGDRWHADHIEPVERVLAFVREGHSTRMRATGAFHRPERNCIENLNPACAPCNIDKHAMKLEDWRGKLSRSLDVLARNQPTFRHAVRFGLLDLKPAAIVFHFERVSIAAAKPTEEQGS